MTIGKAGQTPRCFLIGVLFVQRILRLRPCGEEKVGVVVSTEVKYSKQDIVWERADCCGLSVTLACTRGSQKYRLATAVYLDRYTRWHQRRDHLVLRADKH